ncbi:hypothetical protein [Burkholderia gladioli]|uniref:hypothetical protein n=1 Tax=Burkholderia gladioli TaxID=28095 RepID=UPI000F526A9A|nr:hypothetical protein [Burkholderia gladioli]
MLRTAIPARPSSGAPLRCAEPRSLLMLHIVSDAMRAAALASSDRVALDIAGDVLRRLAELIRGEVSYG